MVRRGRLGLPGGRGRSTVHRLAARRLRAAVAAAGRPQRGASRGRPRFAAAGRHTLAPPSLSVSDPLGARRVRMASDGAADELLVLPRTEPVRWLAPSAAARRSELRTAVPRRRPWPRSSRRPAPVPAGHAGQPDPLAGARPRRRADRAPAARRQRLTRPLVVLDAAGPRRRGRRAARRRRPGRRVARRSSSRAGAAAGCCCPASARPTRDRPRADRVAGGPRAAGAGRRAAPTPPPALGPPPGAAAR